MVNIKSPLSKSGTYSPSLYNIIVSPFAIPFSIVIDTYVLSFTRRRP